MKEIEVKILEIEPTIVEQKLPDAKKIFEGPVDTYMYENKLQNSKVRLRLIGDTVLITHKTKIENEKAKIADETEITVDSLEESMKLFEALGFEQTKSHTKNRTSYEYKNVHIEIDTFTDKYSFVPTFLEIESESYNNILDVVKELGYAESDCKNWNGAEVVEYYQSKID